MAKTQSEGGGSHSKPNIRRNAGNTKPSGSKPIHITPKNVTGVPPSNSQIKRGKLV